MGYVGHFLVALDAGKLCSQADDAESMLTQTMVQICANHFRNQQGMVNTLIFFFRSPGISARPRLSKPSPCYCETQQPMASK